MIKPFKSTFTIALDGPAASGKSSTAKQVAKELNISYLDTGAMYRAVTLFSIKNNINWKETDKLLRLTSSLFFNFYFQKDEFKVEVNGIDITDAIRTIEVTNNVSDYCAVREVREILVKTQRQYGEKTSCILDGRDIGTVVFPDSQFKFYFHATAEARAERRVKEFIQKGIKVDFSEILADIKTRDEKDSARKESPLKIANDAMVVDTTHMKLEEQVELIVNKVKEAGAV